MIKEESGIELFDIKAEVHEVEPEMQVEPGLHGLVGELHSLAPTGNMLAFDSLPEWIQSLPKNSPEIFENLTSDRVLFWLNFLHISTGQGQSQSALDWLRNPDGFIQATDLERVNMIREYSRGSEMNKQLQTLRSSPLARELMDFCKNCNNNAMTPQTVLSYFVNGRDVEELKTCLPLFFAKDETVHMGRDGDLNTLYTRYVNILPELKSEHLEAKNLALDESFKREHPVRSAIEKCCCFSLQCLRPAQYRH